MIEGFFQLKTPIDLLEKLRHDVDQINLHPFDTYLAFNFFVTAEAMLDWIYPGNRNRSVRSELRKSEPLLQVTSDLATGAKHFSGLQDIHNSVNRTDISAGYFPRGSFPIGAFPVGSFGNGVLQIYLEKGLSEEGRKTITALELAHKVLDYWERALATGTVE